MKYIFELAKTNLELSKEEAQALYPGQHKQFGNILLVKTNKKITDRLAYTKVIYQFLFETSTKNLERTVEKFDWDKVYKNDFSVKVKNKENIEKKLAKIIWSKLKKPKVELKHSTTEITFFFLKNKVICGIKKYENKGQFEERRSHLRPRPSPVSLHPKLARAMVNLTGAGKKDLVFDPFCGSGGILIEAGLMKLNAKGSDINKKMVWKSIVNVHHYKIPPQAEIKDFFNIQRSYKYIVTDPPYGLNASIMKNIRINRKQKEKTAKEIEVFFEKIIKHLCTILLKRAVIMVPHYINYKKLIQKSKLKLKKEFDSYIHNNLTRKILVLEK